MPNFQTDKRVLAHKMWKRNMDNWFLRFLEASTSDDILSGKYLSCLMKFGRNNSLLNLIRYDTIYEYTTCMSDPAA